MRCATITAALAVPESVAVICPALGLADMPRHRLSVHCACVPSVSLSTCTNVMPLPLTLETVTVERHATQTRMRSLAAGVHEAALMLLALAAVPKTVSAVAIATARRCSG